MLHRFYARSTGRFALGLLRDRRGAVAIEYGLLVAMLAIALIGMVSMSGVAEKQSDTYNLLSNSMSN